MNVLFQTRKPRHFHHEMIYSDGRRERLEALEQRARQELGMSDAAERRPGMHIRGAFVSPRVARKKSRRGTAWGNGALALLLLLCFCVLMLMLLE